MRVDLESELVIRERIRRVEEVAAQLKVIRASPREAFLQDRTTQYAAMYAMVVGIEAICDIGNHILAKYCARAAESYRDVILFLAECGVIPQAFARESAPMADFRNILVHLYLDVDLEQVWENLQKAPEEFGTFCRYFLQFLERPSPGGVAESPPRAHD